MLKLRKRWILPARSRQLRLDLGAPRRSLSTVMRSAGARRLVAAVVALVAGWLTHPHLLVVVIPVVVLLLVQAWPALQHSIKKGGVAIPLKWISLVQGREGHGLRRPQKYRQKRLEF